MGPAGVKQVALTLIVVIIGSCLALPSAHAQNLRIEYLDYAENVQYNVDAAWVRTGISYDHVFPTYGIGVDIFATHQGKFEAEEVLP